MFNSKDYVLEIYKTGSFSKAASNLYISQPSLSMIVKRLEEKIGEEIFDRSSHPIKLTDCGKQYLASASLIQEAEDDFLSYLDAYRNLEKGNITIGGSNMNISYILPPLITNFKSKYPKININIVEGNIDTLEAKLLNGEIDLLIDSCNMDTTIIQHYLYIREQLLIVVPDNIELDSDVETYALRYDDILSNKHCLTGIEALPLTKLHNIPFIFLTSETDTYIRATELCRHYSYSPNIIMSFNQSATAFNLARAGIGATFVSDELVKNITSKCDMKFFKILPQYGTRYIKFFSKRSHRLTYAMRAFISIAQAGIPYASYDIPNLEKELLIL